ncbi:hypothetical protein LIA77_07649 [Sarocladium implicatum]|nr:hypothetical protein LIA77_07649 [Sarocladium implicatum]
MFLHALICPSKSWMMWLQRYGLELCCHTVQEASAAERWTVKQNGTASKLACLDCPLPAVHERLGSGTVTVVFHGMRQVITSRTLHARSSGRDMSSRSAIMTSDLGRWVVMHATRPLSEDKLVKQQGPGRTR